MNVDSDERRSTSFDLCIPIASCCIRDFLGTLTENLLSLLTEGAIEQLIVNLAERIVLSASPTIEADLDLFLSLRNEKYLNGLDKGISVGSTYIHCIKLKDWRHPLTNDPTLYAHLDLLCKRYLSAVHLMLERYFHDRNGFAFKASGKIAALKVGAGDWHNGGAVTIIGTTNNDWIAYKPRDISSATLFCKVAAWVNENIVGAIKAPNAIEMEGYGWMEFIHLSSTVSDPRLFSYRYGILSVIAYILGLRDLHWENVIVSEDYPVVIDTEAVLCPVHAFNADVTYSDVEAGTILGDSLLDTGLLPRWEVLFDNVLVDLSPLCTELPFVPNQYWCSLERELGPLRNWRDELERRDIREDRLKEMERGIRDAWRVVAEKSAEIEGIVRGFSSISRAVIRPTHFYARLLRYSLHPTRFRTNESRLSCLRGVLSSNLHDFERRRFHAGIADEECRALMNGEIPYFFVRVDELALRTPRFIAGTDFFKRTGLSGFRARLCNLTSHSLALQVNIVKMSFEYRFAHSKEYDCIGGDKSVNDIAGSFEIPEVVGRIIQVLRENQMTANDGYPTWISAGLPDSSGHLSYSLLDNGLYSGRLGVQLFLSAYSRYANDNWSEETASLLLTSLVSRASSRKSAHTIASFYGTGGAFGCGAFLYGFALENTFDSQGKCKRSGTYICETLRKEDWTGHPLDVITGLAGLILGALAFFEATKEELALEVARSAGLYLASEVRKNLDRNHSATVPLGFAHGLSGIALALDRAAIVIGNEELAFASALALRTVVKAIDAPFEPDMLHGGPLSKKSWCWGLAGDMALEDALSRNKLANSLESPIDNWIREIIIKGGNPNPWTLHNLCCGSAGIIDALLDSKRAHAPKAAALLATDLLQAIDSPTGYRFYPSNWVKIFNPSLFRGLSGVGYTLLRLHSPKSFPSIARFQVHESN